MKKILLGVALATVMGTSMAHVIKHDVCGESTWSERTLFKAADAIGKDLGYTIVDGLKCELADRDHRHVIIFDDGSMEDFDERV